MYDILKIQRFASIEDIHIHIKPLVIIMGEHSSGKSTISQIVHFFKYNLDKIAKKYVLEKFLEERLDIKSYIINAFKKALEHIDFTNLKNFFVEYSYYQDKNQKYYTIVIKSTNEHGIECSGDIFEYLDIFASDYLQVANRIKLVLNNVALNDVAELAYVDIVDDTQSMYIPASRSLLSIIKYNSFNSDILESLKIDNYFKSLGNIFLDAIEYLTKQISNSDIDDLLIQHIKSDLSLNLKIKNGEIFFETKNDNGKAVLFLRDLSSGQKEAMPIYITLSYILSKYKEMTNHITIEEPEAHLHPHGQYNITKYISKVVNELNTQNGYSTVVITTHSPYIVSSVNHLMMVNDLYNQLDQNTDKKYIKTFETTIAKNEMLDKNKVSAYKLTVHNKKQTSIAEQIIVDDLISQEELDGTIIEILQEYQKLKSMVKK